MHFAYYYQEEFCEADHYRGLYPVRYFQEADKQPFSAM